MNDGDLVSNVSQYMTEPIGSMLGACKHKDGVLFPS